MLLRILAVFGYTVLLMAQSTDSNYGGPSVLSRGLVPTVATQHGNIEFRPRIGVSGTCDNGLTAVTVDSRGRLPNVFACGVEVNAGVSGYHTWRRTRLGLEYAGNFRHYSHNSYYDGTDQLLGLGLSHQLSKRWMLSLREAGGMYSRNYLGIGGGGYYDPALLQQPAANLFDSPLIFGTTAADLTYIVSARWSVNMGGAAFAERFRSTALFGATSYGAHGDAVYRYSRYGSIGVAYQFLHTEFTKSFGSFDYHVISGVYSIRPRRSVELQLQGGVGRIETLSVQRVAIDPVIAAITGQTSGVLAAYHLNYYPELGAGLTKAFQHSLLSLRYNRSISAGNGVYLTSESETAMASFSYTGVRHWSFSAAGGYNKLKAIQQSLGIYSGYTAGLGIVRTLGAGVQLTLQLDERHYDTGYAGFRRDAFRASLGFMWSPGDIPLTLW
jgi:hypothetical protein